MDINGRTVVPGAFIQTTTKTSGTAFVTSALTNTARVRLWAGGGAGGGAATAAVSGAAGGGGASGGYAEKTFAVSPSTSYVIAIGAGGIPGSVGNNPGGAGGITTFAVGGTTVTANGGLGGTGMAAGTTINSVIGGASPAVSTSGDLNAYGIPGAPGFLLTGLLAESGEGGATSLGGAGNSSSSAGAGAAGQANTGSGGAGGVVLNASAAVAGGAGGTGVISVDEYQ